MKRVTPKRKNAVPVPPGLPDDLRSPSIPLDPNSPPQNRRFQAYAAYVTYTRGMERWLREHNLKIRAVDVQKSLKTTLADFFRVADELDPHLERGT
jgi:hypothetical protein